MRRGFLLSTTSCMLLLVYSFISTCAQSSFVPVEWTPQASPSEECGLAITSNLSDALTTVALLVKSTTSSSSLPKSCIEIKESSPVSPSGYYTISTGTGVSVIVFCNMDELYSCPSLEQTLKEFTNTLATCEKIYTSCQEVWNKCPQCTSGYYKILAADLTAEYVHCNFNEKCGTAGPWTRVAFLNMSDGSSVCPSGTQKFVNGSAIACGIQDPGTTCVSIITSTTHSYSQICGQVAGYQKGSTSAFQRSINDINGFYVEGISITRGSPRQHVWTYAIGVQENIYYDKNNPGAYICPCGSTSVMQVHTVPSFVGSDYYCESGCPGINNVYTFYSDDVLWDGQQCGLVETGCCIIPGQPWFHKILDTSSSDSIEIRLCIDEATDNENVLVSLYDIYVK